MSKTVATEFSPQAIALLTISDTRTEATDKSGHYLAGALEEAGHKLYDKQILPDHKYRIRALLSHWIAAAEVRVIIATGGTGFADRDITPEAVRPLLDKEIPGFGELFRQASIDEIGTSALQSRALAGIANGTFIFCLPGSVNACRTAWEKILKQQLDIRNRPCNFVELFPRITQER
jgi:molybdenum cofactor biosynthesis protein B